MDFKLTEEQELLLNSLKELVEREVTEEKIRQWYAEGTVSTEFTKAFLDAGFGTLGIPEEYGGTPADISTMMLVAQYLTKYTGAFVQLLSSILVLYDVIEFGTKEQIEMCMKLYHDTGKAPFSLAISEPQAGSDNSGMTTVATEKEGKIVLNGSKTFVTAGFELPYMMVIAKDDTPDRANKNMSMWLMPANTPGITISKLHKVGQQTAIFCEVFLDNVTIDKSCLVGERGKGFLQLMQNFEVERLLVAAMSLGLAEAAMEDAAKYASQREAFGQQIYKYQLVAEHLTDMEIKLINMNNILYKTTWEVDNKISVRLTSALTKRYVCQASFEVADSAMQVFGGIGYTEDCRVSRIWKDLRGQRFAGGTDEIMVHIAGREIIKKYNKS